MCRLYYEHEAKVRNDRFPPQTKQILADFPSATYT